MSVFIIEKLMPEGWMVLPDKYSSLEEADERRQTLAERSGYAHRAMSVDQWRAGGSGEGLRTR